jgi:hypothetical protein
MAYRYSLIRRSVAEDFKAIMTPKSIWKEKASQTANRLTETKENRRSMIKWDHYVPDQLLIIAFHYIASRSAEVLKGTTEDNLYTPPLSSPTLQGQSRNQRHLFELDNGVQEFDRQCQ